ncbi:MAG: gamma-glutamyltransferase family protein [Verrucomicrobia bacterium]|nr:MAG: gamma-glutamyltransferase family protein [Verrucomicrobiota bacterium]
MHRALPFVLAAAVALAARGGEARRPVGRSFATRSEVIARHGMACTSHPLATQAALEVMRQGGGAVDAAIAANACLGLMEPTGSGVGGDLFAVVWSAKDRRLHGLNASGRSPASLVPEEFQKRGLRRIPSYGPLPITVPGCVDGWFALHERFGRLPMAADLAPAIRHAEEGFPMTEVIADAWARNVARLAEYPNIRAVYMPGGRAPAKGEVFRNPALASTLRRIAAGGRDAFYKGDMAAAICDFVRRQGGFLGPGDFAAHHSDWVDPVSTNYRGFDVWELPPNGQGVAALLMLNLLEPVDLRAAGFGSRVHLHQFIEAKKIAFEDRARFIANPASLPVPMPALLSKDYAAKRRLLVSPDRAATRIPAGDPLGGRDTIYLCTADADGNMVSLIQSNYHGMGSGMCPDGLGFILHDRGEAFDLAPGRPNSYAPGKRPFHTIIPAFVTRGGEPFMAFGVMGGDMQPQGHVQILANLIDFGMNLQEAGDAPRVYHTASSEPTGETMADGGIVHLEPGFDEEVVRDLVAMGHKVGRTAPGSFGGFQGIVWDRTNRVYIGASESRKDGQAAGW